MTCINDMSLYATDEEVLDMLQMFPFCPSRSLDSTSVSSANSSIVPIQSGRHVVHSESTVPATSIYNGQVRSGSPVFELPSPVSKSELSYTLQRKRCLIRQDEVTFKAFGLKMAKKSGLPDQFVHWDRMPDSLLVLVLQFLDEHDFNQIDSMKDIRWSALMQRKEAQHYLTVHIEPPKTDDFNFKFIHARTLHVKQSHYGQCYQTDQIHALIKPYIEAETLHFEDVPLPDDSLSFGVHVRNIIVESLREVPCERIPTKGQRMPIDKLIIVNTNVPYGRMRYINAKNFFFSTFELDFDFSLNMFFDYGSSRALGWCPPSMMYICAPIPFPAMFENMNGVFAQVDVGCFKNIQRLVLASMFCGTHNMGVCMASMPMLRMFAICSAREEDSYIFQDMHLRNRDFFTETLVTKSVSMPCSLFELLTHAPQLTHVYFMPLNNILVADIRTMRSELTNSHLEHLYFSPKTGRGYSYSAVQDAETIAEMAMFVKTNTFTVEKNPTLAQFLSMRLDNDAQDADIDFTWVPRTIKQFPSPLIVWNAQELEC
jgi:hypothetical protein